MAKQVKIARAGAGAKNISRKTVSSKNISSKTAATGKVAARKAASKRPAAKKAIVKKAVVKKAPAAKNSAMKKATVGKPAVAARNVRKPLAKKPVGQRAASKVTAKAKVAAKAKIAPKAKAKSVASAIRKPSNKPWGGAGKALDGVRILDFTHVQSGPTCTQLLAWFGADVIKVERPGVGDITRGQLRDVPNVDSLYFTMLNHNKRSITIDSKHPQGKAVLDELVKSCDVLVENFAPGALDRMGLTWEHIHKLNPRMIVASVKGFGPGPYEDCKVYENVAQCAGGAASTTGFLDGPPLVTGAQIGDSGTGLNLALGIVCALYQRNRTGRGQKVLAAMQDGVLNLCRVKLRDQQRLAHGPLKEYSQYGQDIGFGEATPRAGNDSGGGQPGWILKCKGWESDPNAYIYFITQAPVWEKICDVIGKPEWKTDPDYAKPAARLPRLKHIFDTIEQWTMTKTKFEAMDLLNTYDIPCGPILSMKEIAEEESLRKTGTVVEVDHPTRGKYLTVGNPVKMSDSISEVKRSPLLGEHTDEILRSVLKFDRRRIAEVLQSGALGEPLALAAE
ncbi:formyl-CoA transferase [Rhizobiales bacterium GAS191]|nr:formyl-CoA transferase [Rhizobiales bacterium GAS113]SEE22501.1 formyl-CoA transferase [Rhizobiales bacterium GAS191]SEE33728.1 formyl-CoA transferase [Rhizobiales bacterium GAS188]